MNHPLTALGLAMCGATAPMFIMLWVEAANGGYISPYWLMLVAAIR